MRKYVAAWALALVACAVPVQEQREKARRSRARPSRPTQESPQIAAAPSVRVITDPQWTAYRRHEFAVEGDVTGRDLVIAASRVVGDVGLEVEAADVVSGVVVSSWMTVGEEEGYYSGKLVNTLWAHRFRITVAGHECRIALECVFFLSGQGIETSMVRCSGAGGMARDTVEMLPTMEKLIRHEATKVASGRRHDSLQGEK